MGEAHHLSGHVVPPWGNRGGGGGGGGGGDVNVTVVTGALNEEITTSLTEIVIGGFIFDPTIFSAGQVTRFRALMTAVQTGMGLGFPQSVRLYDRGAPGTPVAGVLRSTLSVFFDSNVPIVRNAVLTPSAAPGVGSDEIFNSERMYELRAFAELEPNDSLIIRWAGLEVA